MASTHKKVVVRKLDRDSVQGYLPPANFISDSKLEILNTAGTAIRIELSEVKGVFFVREFGDSESLQRKTFTSRPRTEGLWVRLRWNQQPLIGFGESHSGNTVSGLSLRFGLLHLMR